MHKPRDPTWSYFLSGEFSQPYFKTMEKKIDLDRRHGTRIYPASWNVFKALDLCPPSEIKVVVLGQDPYHTPGLATGVAFSIPNNQPIPPTLRNIFRALKIDTKIVNEHGDLDFWAIQGVLLLNTVLTVEAGKPGSHKGLGWEPFTDRIIQVVNEIDRPILFVLLGKDAQSKKHLITNPKHAILETSHPSPANASKGFLFFGLFTKINDWCIMNKYKPINWKI